MSEPSTRPGSKTELLERMRAGREEWDALIAQIPDNARTEPTLAGGWSVKDLIAHVAAYEKWTAAQIRAANEGRAPTNRELYGVEEMPDDPEGWDLDRQNAAIYAQYKETSVLRRKRATPKRKRRDNGAARQAQRASLFLDSGGRCTLSTDNCPQHLD